MLKRQTKNSAAYDIKVNETKILKPGECYTFETDINFKVKSEQCVLVLPRSSFSIKKKCRLMTGTSLIDQDFYPNTIKVPVQNFGTEDVLIEAGERVAQGLVIKYETLDNEILSEVIRDGGIGSTGKE